MAKKKINAKNNIREFPYEGVRRDNRIKELAKKLKINPYQLKDLVDQKLKPGIKVMGKRFFSNIDTMAGYLNEVGKKNLANTPRSEIKRIYNPAMGVHGITDAQKLKYLSKVHDIHPSVIKDALKAGANPKSLINTMMHETLPSESISNTYKPLCILLVFNFIDLLLLYFVKYFFINFPSMLYMLTSLIS